MIPEVIPLPDDDSWTVIAVDRIDNFFTICPYCLELVCEIRIFKEDVDGVISQREYFSTYWFAHAEPDLADDKCFMLRLMAPQVTGLVV